MQLHFNRSDTDFEANAFDPIGSIYQSDYHQNLPQFPKYMAENYAGSLLALKPNF